MQIETSDRATGSVPSVTVIVVNYNGTTDLEVCLRQLLADGEGDKEIVVVDNDSGEASKKVLYELASAETGIRVIASERNLGYAGAVNLALPECRGTWIAVLNMDTAVEPGWLGPLIGFMARTPDAGAANPLMLLGDGERINAAGQNIHVTGLGFNRSLGRAKESVGRSPFRVSGIQGGAFVARRDILVRIGGMDSSGFLYHEDVNLSWLLRLAGFELYCVPASIVRHDYYLSMYPAKYHLLERNRWTMLLAYLRPSTLVILSPLLLLTELLALGYCLLRGPSFLGAKLRTFRWLWSSRELIRTRKDVANRVRVRSDWRVLAALRWNYEWDQFLTLGRERGESARQPRGGLSVDQ